MEHVPFQAKECDIRNSPRLGDEVNFVMSESVAGGSGVITFVFCRWNSI